MSEEFNLHLKPKKSCSFVLFAISFFSPFKMYAKRGKKLLSSANFNINVVLKKNNELLTLGDMVIAWKLNDLPSNLGSAIFSKFLVR